MNRLKKLLLPILILMLVDTMFSMIHKNQSKKNFQVFDEKEILKQLDQAFKGTPNEHFPKGRPEDVTYNFFPDLEHGYFVTAGSRIHLYADSTRWAIVFEKSGYENRGFCGGIDLNYFGNCIDYPIDVFPERNYISNTSSIVLIDKDEFQRIENKVGEDIDTFELIASHIKEIRIRDTMITFDSNYENYEKLGIKVREFSNPNKLIGFGDLIRYLHETNPLVISATEVEIKKHIPQDIPKLMVIDEFHFKSQYDEGVLPSEQETYKLIAKVLVSRDTSLWKPTQPANNSWKNWDSGGL